MPKSLGFLAMMQAPAGVFCRWLPSLAATFIGLLDEDSSFSNILRYFVNRELGRGSKGVRNTCSCRRMRNS